jgi:hypothetical protein
VLPCFWLLKIREQRPRFASGITRLMFVGFGKALSRLKPKGRVALRWVSLRCVGLIGLSPLQEAKGKADVTVEPSANGHRSTGVVKPLLPIPLENV